MRVVEAAILSTDLAEYFRKRRSFLDLVENGEICWQDPLKKERECPLYYIAERTSSLVSVNLEWLHSHQYFPYRQTKDTNS